MQSKQVQSLFGCVDALCETAVSWDQAQVFQNVKVVRGIFDVRLHLSGAGITKMVYEF